MTPRILLVPGLAGSTMYVDDALVWPCPLAFVEGHLTKLAWPEPVDVGCIVELAYGALRVSLSLAEWHVDTHPYDWRRPLHELVSGLEDRLELDDVPTILVGHSLGGLMSAIQAVNGVNYIVGVVAVCAPFLGTDAPFSVYDGTSTAIEVLSAVDIVNSADRLAGIAKSWPIMGDMTSVRVSTDDERIVCVACSGTPTRHGGAMVDGDGVVTLASASPDGLRTIVVDASHALACDHPMVIESIMDIVFAWRTT